MYGTDRNVSGIIVCVCIDYTYSIPVYMHCLLPIMATAYGEFYGEIEDSPRALASWVGRGVLCLFATAGRLPLVAARKRRPIRDSRPEGRQRGRNCEQIAAGAIKKPQMRGILHIPLIRIEIEPSAGHATGLGCC